MGGGGKGGGSTCRHTHGLGGWVWQQAAPHPMFFRCKDWLHSKCMVGR